MSLELTIDAERLQKAILQQPKTLKKNLNNAIERSLRVFARAARDKAPKAFSTLTNSIGVTRQGPLEGTVGPAVDYSAAVELGTRGGSLPPVQNIQDWIGVVGITPSDPSMDQRDLAWAIANSIATGGTPAQPYMRPAFEENKHIAERLIDVAINASLAA